MKNALLSRVRMKKIAINNGLSSGFRSDFDHVNSIEIEDKPFAVGGFGEVYNCISINGSSIQVSLVVKLFIDNSRGSSEHGFKITQRLQKKFDTENRKLLFHKGKSLTEVYPAFKGLPQYSFRGTMNGVAVVGFVSDNLVSLGYTDFEHFLQNGHLLSQYQKFPIERKVLIAYQLVSAFKVLEDFHFIHADLKPGALFINLSSAEIAVIDFDSGVITETVNDEPTCWGAANDWVAPEIWEQQATIQKGEKINVDIYSDRWSVAVGVHYLLTAFHPLFYLTELSPRVAKQYFTPQNKWPYIDKNVPYFQKANETIYDQYLPWIESVVPPVVSEKLSNTINFGYKNPVARTSYTDWETALLTIQKPARIEFFKADKTAIINSLDIVLSWEVENAHTIEIDNGIGQIQPKGMIKTKPNNNIRYRLSAFGYFGQSSSEVEITVFPTPVIESLKVPMPDFKSRLNIIPSRVSTLKIDFSVELGTHSKGTQVTNPLADLKEIRPIHSRSPFFHLSKVYDEIRRRISK